MRDLTTLIHPQIATWCEGNLRSRSGLMVMIFRAPFLTGPNGSSAGLRSAPTQAPFTFIQIEQTLLFHTPGLALDWHFPSSG